VLACVTARKHEKKWTYNGAVLVEQTGRSLLGTARSLHPKFLMSTMFLIEDRADVTCSSFRKWFESVNQSQ
jgi:hypothetical protein